MINVMKKIFRGLISLSVVASLFVACNEDKGNYEYDYESVTKVKIDTTGVDRTALWAAWNVGDTIRFYPNIITTGDSANIKCSYFVYPTPYNTVQDGNAQVYPPADTIYVGQHLDYIVDLTPGATYALYMVAEDTVAGVKDYMMLDSWLSIPEEGVTAGIYCVGLKDGKLDIDVIESMRALIHGWGMGVVYRDMWSQWHPDKVLTSPVVYANAELDGDYFYMFLEDGTAMRVNYSNMAIMDEGWENLFYDAPTFAPQGMEFTNGCDFLVNDGKMHVLYNKLAGDRMFPAPITGTETVSPWLQFKTLSKYGHVEGAIDAYQVVYDEVSQKLRPYFSKATTYAGFAPAAADVAFDVNNMPGHCLYGASISNDESLYVINNGGSVDLYVVCFNNVIDDGKLARKKVSLAKCPGIASAKVFTSTIVGNAFYYGTGNKLYSFAYATGATEPYLLWEGEAGDEIRAARMLSTGGFPTEGRVMWVGVWNESKQEGKVLEFEVDPELGTPSNEFGMDWFGIEENPTIYEGFGKIDYIFECTGY